MVGKEVGRSVGKKDGRSVGDTVGLRETRRVVGKEITKEPMEFC
jgi:hypothetical protein